MQMDFGAQSPGTGPTEIHFCPTFMTLSQNSSNLHSIQCNDLSVGRAKQFAFPGMLRKYCHGTYRHALQKDPMVPLKAQIISQNILVLHFYTSRSSVKAPARLRIRSESCTDITPAFGSSPAAYASFNMKYHATLANIYISLREPLPNVWSTFVCPSDTNAPFYSRNKADQSHVSSKLMLFETRECCRLGKRQLPRAIMPTSEP